jgi:hypothetical protein
MAACSAIESLTLGCENAVGGIKEIYLLDMEDLASVADSSPEGIIDTITTVGGATYKKFEFKKNTGVFSETKADGTTFFTQTVTIVIPKMEYVKRNKIMLLAEGERDLSLIVKDSNGKFWLVGEENGVILSTAEVTTGTARTDANQYTLTFVGEEMAMAKEVDSSIIPALVS